jgi:hypothetical protein
MKLRLTQHNVEIHFQNGKPVFVQWFHIENTNGWDILDLAGKELEKCGWKNVKFYEANKNSGISEKALYTAKIEVG